MKISSLIVTTLLAFCLAGCGSASKSEKPAICQSCAMPMSAESNFGTEVDGTPSADYCTYCYQEGSFTYDCTMEQMLEFCAQQTEQIKPAEITSEAFMAHLREVYPTLKRWKE